jgi:hypothetical protein
VADEVMRFDPATINPRASKGFKSQATQVA